MCIRGYTSSSCFLVIISYIYLNYNNKIFNIKTIDKLIRQTHSKNDFSKAIIASVNHNGDSDSTGAVTGNILGALLGYDAIDLKWKNDLELIDIILRISDDLCCMQSAHTVGS